MRLIIILSLLLLNASTAWSFNLAPQKLPFSVNNLPFSVKGTQHTLEEYRGHKVMLWLFSTWCHTCVASVKTMQKNQATWDKTGLVILAVRNYKNGGYPGMLMLEFLQKIAPDVIHYKNWVLGEASVEMDEKLNRKKFPDIYFLIDENGQVQAVDTAPNMKIKAIIEFAEKPAATR